MYGDLLAAGDALVGDLGLTSARVQVLAPIALSPVPLPVAHIARNMGLTRQGRSAAGPTRCGPTASSVSNPIRISPQGHGVWRRRAGGHQPFELPSHGRSAGPMPYSWSLG